MVYIYCDESCHLEHDHAKCMTLGAISCDKKDVRKFSEELRNIKKKYGLSRTFELKWTKVGNKQLDYYKSVVDFVFNRAICFRAIVANKAQLRHEDFSQTHDEWYYKMYYLLLRELIDVRNEYRIFLDIKDTHGGTKVRKLHDVLNHSLYEFCDETIQGVQQILSYESELLQVADLLIGCVGYIQRGLKTSEAKIALAEYIQDKAGSTLRRTSPHSEEKFNIFVWQARE